MSLLIRRRRCKKTEPKLIALGSHPLPSVMEGHSQKRQKRTQLTLAEQAEAARILRLGTNAVSVMHQFGISRRTVTNIKTKCEQIIRQADAQYVSLNLKTMCSTLFPQIDIDVMRFVTLSRNMGFPVTQAVLQDRALLIQERLLKHSDLNLDDKGILEAFCASKG